MRAAPPRKGGGCAIFYKRDTPLPVFIPLPRFLVAGEYSVNAKLLYGLLLSRTQLSQRSGWTDEAGRVYVIYPIRQMAEDLNRSERTVKTALNELENAGLLVRVRQGWNRANRLFLCLPEGQSDARAGGGACPMEGQDASPCMGQNLPPNKNDEIENNRRKNKEREALRCFGEFQNVFLSEGELTALQADFPERWEEYIGRLSAYMASSGRHYANHCATLRKWLNEDSRGAKTYSKEAYTEGDCL